MKYYVDIVYIMIVNGVIISNDKNKNIIEMRLKNIVKTANGLSNVFPKPSTTLITKFFYINSSITVSEVKYANGLSPS